MLPEDQCVNPCRSTMDMTLAVRRLQKHGSNARVPFHRLTESKTPSAIISVISDTRSLWRATSDDGRNCESHDEMRAYVSSDNDTSLQWFERAQGLRQVCVLSPLLLQHLLLHGTPFCVRVSSSTLFAFRSECRRFNLK